MVLTTSIILPGKASWCLLTHFITLSLIPDGWRSSVVRVRTHALCSALATLAARIDTHLLSSSRGLVVWFVALERTPFDQSALQHDISLLRHSRRFLRISKHSHQIARKLSNGVDKRPSLRLFTYSPDQLWVLRQQMAFHAPWIPCSHTSMFPG
jgi:hypothetical protein